MKTTINGLELIKRFEGFAATPYLCPAGYPTVGYGHVVLAGEDFSGGVSQAQATDLLRADVRVSERAVQRLVSVPLEEYQFDALVSFTYNLGGGALQRSGLRRKLLRQEYIAAADEFPRWVYAGGRRLSGLIRRREAERALFLQK
jgi:lysozyme